MYKLIKSFSDDMYNLMLGLPKCSKGGRCNLDIKVIISSQLDYG